MYAQPTDKVISSDLCAPRLRRKQHYNSFHPSLGYFLPLAEAQHYASQGRTLPRTMAEYAAIGSGPMRSLDGQSTYPSMAAAKSALYEAWRRYLEDSANGH